ncbi:MAG: DUF4321 domain-containing protein [Methylocystaceae bacterium]
MNSRHTSWSMLLLLMVVGALIFAYLGELVVAYVPGLARWGSGSMVGVPAVTLNLSVIKLSLSLLIKVNLFTVLGLITGFLVFRRL